MSVQGLVGKSFNEPISSNNDVGDVRLLWDNVQKQRLKGLELTATDGTTLGYTLLYYIPGLTTYCGIHGSAILTGYMSGCYLFRYRSRGDLRAAHVGTHDTNEEWSTRAKDAWKAYSSQPHITEIFGCDPINDVSDELLAQAARVGVDPRIIGAWEANGSMRVGIVVADPNQDGNRILVGLEPPSLRPWDVIQNEPKML